MAQRPGVPPSLPLTLLPTPRVPGGCNVHVSVKLFSVEVIDSTWMVAGVVEVCS